VDTQRAVINKPGPGFATFERKEETPCNRCSRTGTSLAVIVKETCIKEKLAAEVD
jgi:hypothetical protein